MDSPCHFSLTANYIWRSFEKRNQIHMLHTYIIGHYNPSVRIIDLFSYTTYVVCVNFIRKWRDLPFKVDSEQQGRQQIFWETFHGNFIYSVNFCQKSAERKSPKKYFFCVLFWPGARTLTNKPTYYLLDYGDFTHRLITPPYMNLPCIKEKRHLCSQWKKSSKPTHYLLHYGG